jgi:hypothetical protein
VGDVTPVDQLLGMLEGVFVQRDGHASGLRRTVGASRAG